MANYSDLTTMFNIRNWFEFKNSSDMGFDTITGTSLLGLSGPLSISGFWEDPDFPGFPTVGQSLYADDTDDLSFRNTLVKIETIGTVLGTAEEGISFTAMFNYIHNVAPPGSPVIPPPGTPVPPPGTPLPFMAGTRFNPDNPRLRMNGLINNKVGIRGLTPPESPLPRLNGQSPCMPPYDVCFPDKDEYNTCSADALSLKVSASPATDNSFLAIQNTSWERPGGSFEFSDDYPDDHPGEFYWEWSSNWTSEYIEISSLPYEENGYANGETIFNFGYNGSPIRLEFEIVDNGLPTSHYAGSTFLPYEQVFNVMNKNDATSMGFLEASFVIVNKDQDPDTITEADIKLGWYAWTNDGGITVYDVSIVDGVQQTIREVTNNIEASFPWYEDKYLEYAEGYNIQSLSYWEVDHYEQYLLDTRNIKIVAYINRGTNTDSNTEHWVRYCPMACAADGPLETPIPDMALFNIKGTNDDVDIIIESNSTDSYITILDNNVYLTGLIPVELTKPFTITASIDTEAEYPDSEYKFNPVVLDEDLNELREEKIFTIANAEYLMITINSEKESNDVSIDIYGSDDFVVHSCRDYHDMNDTIKVIGDTTRISVSGNATGTSVSIVDQDGNKGLFITKTMLNIFLDGGKVLETQLQSSVLDISDFILTDARNIEPAGTPIPIDPFRGQVAEFIISDSLKDGEVFRLHSILNGLFLTETMEDLDSLYGSMFWYKFVNGKTVGQNRFDAFLGYDEIYDVNSSMIRPDLYYSNSEDYNFALSCPMAFYIPFIDSSSHNDNIIIDKKGYARTQEMLDIADLAQTHYSTTLIHLNPHNEDLTEYDYGDGSALPEEYSSILHMGDDGTINYSIKYLSISVGALNDATSLADLIIVIQDEGYEIRLDETVYSVIPTNKPFVLYLGIDAISLTVAIDGNIVYSQPRVAFDWNYLLDGPVVFGVLLHEIETRDYFAPPMYVSDYIQHKGPLNQKSLKKVSSIYNAGDPSYSRMVDQIPTIENIHHMIKTNHRLNLSEEVDRGIDIITGKRIPVTFTGGRYAKIPGHPHIEGILLDGQADKRGCTISQIYKNGYFNTAADKNSWIQDDATLNQIISIGTFMYHDNLKKFNLLRWNGAINPEDNWIEIIISAKGTISYQVSLNGVETTLSTVETSSNFGLNSFFMHFSLYILDNTVLRMRMDIHFGDTIKTVLSGVDIAGTGLDTDYLLTEIATGSTLEIAGGKNMNQYMDSDFSMSGIISDIIFFSNTWTDIDAPVSLFRTNKDNPPGAIGQEKGHGGLGKGSSGSGVITVNSHDGVEPGVDAMPLVGTHAALLISETNDYNSPVLTMRPIIDVKVSDGFAGAPYTDTYLVPIPSCSGVDLSILKLALTDPFEENGSNFSISDHGSESNYYWHSHGNPSRTYGRNRQWDGMRTFNDKPLEEGPFCQREGLVYDFVKYNGKIAFSFLARYTETDKDTAYGDRDINHQNEYRGKRLYHYNNVGYLDQSMISGLKWGYKYFDDGSNGDLGILRANRNNGFIHLAGNNQPHTFNMSNFQDRLDRAQNYNELCQHQQFRCGEGDSGYGGEYGGEYY